MHLIGYFCIILATIFAAPLSQAQVKTLSKSEWTCFLADEPARSSRKFCSSLDNRVKDMAYAYGEDSGNWDDVFECFVMNSGEGCSYLAGSLYDKDETATHLPALLVEERGCRLGYEDACADMDIDDSSFIPKQEQTRIIKSACLRGADEACEYVKINDVTPRKFEPCIGIDDTTFQSNPACTELEDQTKEAARLFSFYDGMGESWMECFELGIQGGCINLEDISYKTFDDKEVELAGHAVILTSRDCRMGNVNACDDLVYKLTNFRYFDRRRDVFSRLCKIQVTEACEYAPAEPQSAEQRRKRDQIYWAIDYFEKSKSQ